MIHMAVNNETITFEELENMNKVDHASNRMVPVFILYLPMIWFILGAIGFIGNIITFLPIKRSSQTSDVYVVSSSIVDIIILSINLYIMYFLPLSKIHLSRSSFEVAVICGILIFLILPHLSINLLFMAYFDRLACTYKDGSLLRKLNRFKMVPWIISLILICSCLPFGYLMTLFFIDSRRNHYDAKIPSYIVCILYILTNGLVPSILMITVILLTYRNNRNRGHACRAINRINSNISRNKCIITIMAQVLTTAVISFTWTFLCSFGFYLFDLVEGSRQLAQAFVFSSYFYHLNNVKSFYVSILTTRSFRERFIKACTNLASRLKLHRRCLTNGNNSSRIRANIREEIPLQPI